MTIKEKRRADWFQKIEEQRHSDISIVKWCGQKAINEKTFRRWKRTLKSEEKTNVTPPVGWCQVQTKPTTVKTASLKLVVNNQITIKLQPDLTKFYSGKPTEYAAFGTLRR